MMGTSHASQISKDKIFILAICGVSGALCNAARSSVEDITKLFVIPSMTFLFSCGPKG